MAKTFEIINRLPYTGKFWPELLSAHAKARVPFFSPIAPLYRKSLLCNAHTGWFEESGFALSAFKIWQHVKSLFQCSAPFGGWRNNNGNFNNEGNNANFWSSSENNSNNGWNLNINSNNKKANMNNNNKSCGFSVRCLQNWII